MIKPQDPGQRAAIVGFFFSLETFTLLKENYLGSEADLIECFEYKVWESAQNSRACVLTDLKGIVHTKKILSVSCYACVC